MIRTISTVALVAGIAAGTVADRPAMRPPLTLGGYRVLAADFHIHSSTWSDGALTPWGLVLEARRQGLDVIAITGHDEVGDAEVGRWFSARIGGPMVLVGQEVVSPGHHVIGVGTEDVVDSRLSVADQADAVHRQGGVAIAAHPLAEFWPAFDETAMGKLDGAEVCHPAIYSDPGHQQELERFAARAPLTAIGSSDFHGTGRMGICRTFVFATEATPAAVLDALRAHRTVVYGLEGRAYGDPDLIALASQQPELRASATVDAAPGTLDWLSRAFSVCGLLGLALGRPRATR